MKRIVLLLLMCALATGLWAQILNADVSTISLPRINWALNADLKGFKVEENKLSANGFNRKVLVTNNDKGYTVSIFIEKAQKEGGDSKDCRKYYWNFAKKSPLDKENLKQYEKGELAIVEHDTKSFKKQQVDYHSLNAYISHGGYWIDVHISKLGYVEADKSMFDYLVSTIKIDEPKKRNESELFLFGSQAFYRNDFSEAIQMYEPLIEMQKNDIALDKKAWRIAVDNLAMSYGITKNYDKCMQVLEYGIKLDGSYPNFYYNKACAFAEQANLDLAIENLEQAYLRKDFVLNGEKLSNPRDDDSFKKYLTDPKFQAFLKKYDL